jgi:hypothetical protein
MPCSGRRLCGLGNIPILLKHRYSSMDFSHWLSPGTSRCQVFLGGIQWISCPVPPVSAQLRNWLNLSSSVRSGNHAEAVFCSSNESRTTLSSPYADMSTQAPTCSTRILPHAHKRLDASDCLMHATFSDLQSLAHVDTSMLSRMTWLASNRQH